MKKLVLVTLVLLLNGCAVIDAYRMARFDNNEYSLVTQVRTQAQLGAIKCGASDVTPYVDAVYVKSLELNNYSSGIAHNEEAAKMTEELLVITRGLKEKYISGEAVSQKYCELKFNNIKTSTELMQKTIGAKPR